MVSPRLQVLRRILKELKVVLRFKSLGIEILHPFGISDSLSWCELGYYLELHSEDFSLEYGQSGHSQKARIQREIHGSITSSLEGQYLISECRHFSHVGETLAHKLYCDCLFYLCLIQSQRMAQMLHAKYKGAGERPVEEVAGLVGFKLPKQYQDSPGDATKK